MLVGAAIHSGALVVVLALYFVPTIVAVARKVTNQGSVIVINVFLGWTFIGWVVALAMLVARAGTETTNAKGGDDERPQDWNPPGMAGCSR